MMKSILLFCACCFCPFALETSDSILSPTQEMITYFEKRTNSHIEKVKENLKLMEGYSGYSLKELTERGQQHDQSKFSEIEINGYIWLTWWHYCQKRGLHFEYPAGVEVIVKNACQHHLTTNAHHPESHKDVNKMCGLDMIEMVCDWTAMSQEYNETSCIKYVVQNINKKWHFSQEKQDKIFHIITTLDSRIAISQEH